jgi:hypothetical protein
MQTNEEKEKRVRERAYQIWLDEGQPQGRDKEHWRQAEAQVSAEEGEHSAQAEPSQQGDAPNEGGGSQPPLPGPYENIS